MQAGIIVAPLGAVDDEHVLERRGRGLFDPEGNVCSVRCDSIESDVFTVSSPMGSFETGVMGGLKTAWCTRGRRPWTDGGLRNLPLDHGRLCSGECAGEPRLFYPPLYD